MFSNCGDSEDSWESLWLQGEQTNHGLMLKLRDFATCCEELTQWKRPWCWKRLRAGGERGLQWMRWLDCITNSMDMSLSKVRKIVKDREACCTVVHEVTKSRIWPSDWTTTEILRESQMTVFGYSKMMTFWFVKDSNHVIKEKLVHYKNISVIYIINTFYWLEYEKNYKAHKENQEI